MFEIAVMAMFHCGTSQFIFFMDRFNFEGHKQTDPNYRTSESTQPHPAGRGRPFFASHFQLRLIYKFEPANSNQPPKGNSLPGDGKNDGSTAPKMILVNQKLTMIITGTAKAARDSETREILVMPV
jgi:hypothetical protein